MTSDAHAAQLGNWSDPGPLGAVFDAVPGTPETICAAVQGVLIHDYFGQHLYADPPSGIAEAPRETLPVSDRLAQILALRDASLTDTRNPADRAVGTCRDFALLACAGLRHHGFSARVRCGFARYFHPPTCEDHWLCEYRSAGSDVWRLADAQLDPAHVRHLGVDFDPVNVPRTEFYAPWEVWQRHRRALDGLSAYGHGDAAGGSFVLVKLARDALSLSGQEVSDWDGWRAQSHEGQALSEADLARGDLLASAGEMMFKGMQVDPSAERAWRSAAAQPPWARQR